MAKSIEAAGAFFRIYTEDAAFRRGLEAVERRLKQTGQVVAGIGGAIAGVGTAITAPFLAAAAIFSEIGSDIADTAARTGASTEFLSGLGYAAKQTGSDLGTVEAGLKKMESTMLAAERGSKKTLDTLFRLGLTAADLKGKSPEQAFGLVADKLAAIEDPGKRAALAMQIFGGAGQKLLPILSQGTAGLATMRAEAASLGLVLSQDQADAADAMGDAWDRLVASVTGVTLAVGSALAPALTQVYTIAGTLISRITAWIAANPKLIQGIALTGAILTAAGTVIAAIGGVLIVAGAAVAGFSAVFGGVGAVIAGILSPIGLAVTAVTTLAGTFVATANLGRGAFTGLYAEIREILGAVIAALTAGDIATAGQILWTELRGVWSRGVNALQDTWSEWKTFAAQVFIELGAQIQTSWTETWASMRSVFVEFQAAFAGIGSEITAGFQAAWARATDAIAGMILRIQGLLDSSFDIDGALGALQQDAERRQQAIENTRNNASTATDTTRQTQLEAIEAQRKSALEAIERNRTGATQANFDRRDEEENKLNDELAALRKQLDAQRASLLDRVPQGNEAPSGSDFEQIVKTITEGTESAVGKIKARGTFEGQFLAQQFGAAAKDEQVEATKRVEEQIKEQRNDLKKVRLVWGV